MQDLFASGRIIDLILFGMLAELIALVAMRRMKSVDAVALLVPGAFLMLALRAALVGAPWTHVAAALAASLAAHIVDLVRRLTR